MRRPSRLTAGAAVATAVLAATLGAGSTAAFAAPKDPNTDSPVTSGVDQSSAIVMLSQAPLTTAPGTRNAKGRVDPTRKETQSAKASLAAQRKAFKDWLRSNAPKATVTGEHDLALNAVTVNLNGTPLSTIQKAPGVVSAQYELLYHPLATVPAKGDFDPADPDLSLIHAGDAWDAGTPGTAKGEGVKVAIVDSGIDLTNPCFDGSDYPTATRIGPRELTNNKVIVARVFSNKTPSRGFTPEALQEHGTHVAGTVACNEGTKATVDGATIDYALAGVAPRALLGNYNVFPGEEATGITNARSEDILDALEAAYGDGMQIANMSLGGDAHGAQDLLTVGVDNLTAAGMLIAVAAGNSGPGAATAESPGSAAGALTAGASSVPHFVGTPVRIAGGSSYGAAAGDFPTVEKDLAAPLAATSGAGVAGLGLACDPLAAGSLAGSIAVISRGTCDFSTKIDHAQDAGAVAVLMVNNLPGVPIAMGTTEGVDKANIPAYMLPMSAGSAFATAAAAHTPATIGADQQYFQDEDGKNLMADFSSAGPVDVTYRIKPDVVAPGVNVLSSIPGWACTQEVEGEGCFAFFQGTSMATPHLSGSAAVLLSQHSKENWGPADLKSALVNTADRDVLRTTKADAYVVNRPDSVQIQGGGLENLLSATHSTLTLNPVSVSFGAVPTASGQTLTKTLTVTNRGTAPVELSAAIANQVTNPGVTFSVSSSPFTVAPGKSATVTVTVTNAKGVAVGSNSAYLVLKTGTGEVAHAALYEYTK